MLKIRIGVLGCANIANKSVIPAIKISNNFELVAIASRSELKAKEFAEKFKCESIVGYQDLVSRKDIDAIYIPLPTGLHEEWIIKSLNYGKHVFSEKSFALNFESAKKIIALAAEKNLVIMEDFMYRFHKQHKYVHDLLSNDSIGEVRFIRSAFCFPPLNSDNFRYNVELGGGCVLDAAAYPINLTRWFLGDDLEILSSNLIYDKHKKICIWGSAELYSKSSSVSSQIFFGFDNYYQCNYQIYGNKGMINCTKAFTPKSDETTKIILSINNNEKEFTIDPDNHFINIVNDFANAIILNDYDRYYNDISMQSRLLTDLENFAVKSYR